MITLKFANTSQVVTELKENLKDLSLAYKLAEDKTLAQPILEDGDLVFEGEKAIKEYLDDLEKELKKWRYCSC